MRIALIRLRLIGDVAFTTPLIRAVRRHYPSAHLTYLVEPAAAPVLRHNPHLNELVVVPRRRGLDRLRDDLTLARRLRRARFDIAVDLHGGPRSGFFTRATGAPMRIGYVIPGRTWMYTHRIPRSADLLPRHSVVNQWDLLAPLGIAPCNPTDDPLEMGADPAADVRVDTQLHAAGVTTATPLLVIHVSAGNPFRRWPAESFTALVVQLVQADPGRRVVLSSGPSQADAGRQIAAAARQRLGGSGAAILDIGEPDLAELRALIDRASVYIGGDTGPMHIAATTRTPIVELLGPTLPERSRPWRDPRWFVETVDVGELPCRPCDQRHCAPGDFRCLTGITPARVAAAVERALRAPRRDGAPISHALHDPNHPNDPVDPIDLTEVSA